MVAHSNGCAEVRSDVEWAAREAVTEASLTRPLKPMAKASKALILPERFGVLDSLASIVEVVTSCSCAAEDLKPWKVR